MLTAVLLLLMAAAHANMVLFGSTESDARFIRSSIDRSIECYRRSLTQFMQAVETTILKMALHKSAIPKTYRSMVASGSAVAGLFEKNEDVIDLLCRRHSPPLQPILGITSSASGSSTSANGSNSTSADITATYTTIDQLLIHLMKDWSDVGRAASSRRNIYGSVLALLESDDIQALLAEGKPTGGDRYRALIPGGGLGRLALEVCVLGKYDVEINELSPLMTAAFSTLVTEMLPQYHRNGTTHEFYPLLTFPLYDDWNFDNRLEAHNFPSSDAMHIAHWVAERANNATLVASLVFQYGAFQNIYSTTENFERFNLIITCFFIDTATDLMIYISTIKNLLRIGGIWINTGPLHYHDKSSVPYSYNYFTSILREVGFEIISQATVLSTYAGEEKHSMKPETYSCCLDAYRLVSRSESGGGGDVADDLWRTDFVLVDM